MGAIAGVVKDPSNAVVAGTVVTSISAVDGGKRAVTSNGQGFFLIPTLMPGEYKVIVEAKGFRTYDVARINVEVGQTARVDVNLTVGTETATATVEVVSEGVAVSAEQATVGGVVSARQIAELPLNGRNYFELARLEPGVEINEGRAFDPTKARCAGVSIGGRSGRETRITIDGIDAVGEHVGTTTLNLSQESIQEFQVSTSSYDASTALSATGGVNIITKRGSNAFHGGAFAFGRGSSVGPKCATRHDSCLFSILCCRASGPARVVPTRAGSSFQTRAFPACRVPQISMGRIRSTPLGRSRSSGGTCVFRSKQRVAKLPILPHNVRRLS